MVDDTCLAVGSEAYAAALQGHNYAKARGQGGVGMQSWVNLKHTLVSGVPLSASRVCLTTVCPQISEGEESGGNSEAGRGDSVAKSLTI